MGAVARAHQAGEDSEEEVFPAPARVFPVPVPAHVPVVVAAEQAVRENSSIFAGDAKGEGRRKESVTFFKGV